MTQRFKTVLVCLFLILPGCGNRVNDLPSRTTIVNVIDGDTIVIENGSHIRLIGIDTPESRECDKLFADASRTKTRPSEIIEKGRKASAFTRHLAESQHILLKYDRFNKGSKHRDKYGRILAYVYIVGPEKIFLNEEIIRQGYGEAMRYFPFIYKDRFTRLEKEARKEKRGLWADDILKHAYIGSLHSNKYHIPTSEHAASIKADNRVYFSSAEEAEALGYLPCKACCGSSE